MEKAAFVALVSGWLKGTDYSQIFSEGSETTFDKENSHITADSGESLRFLDFRGDNGTEAIGFRYDNPDQLGRTWRTELVILTRTEGLPKTVLRTRTQCIAHDPKAKLETPRKPYLIKSFIHEGLVEDDAYFTVSDAPHYLEDTDFGIEVASEIVAASASLHLPVVFLSRDDEGALPLSTSETEKLAFKLGGIAHLVCEPSRSFSFRLREKTEGRNVYGGTVGVFVPGTQRPRKFYIGGAIPDSRTLCDWIIDYCVAARSRIPASGWDWTELQEHALRAQRKREKSRLSSSEIEQLYEEEISTLKERVADLELRLKDGKNAVEKNWGHVAFDNMLSSASLELYEGEISDRVLFLLQIALSVREPQGLDERSVAIAGQILKDNSTSEGLAELKRELAQATKDVKKSGEAMASILEQLGFTRKNDKKHIRMEPDPRLQGLQSVTLSKTPSDYRGPKNHKSQIENILGISKLG